jgi:hypothetical protein
MVQRLVSQILRADEACRDQEASQGEQCELIVAMHGWNHGLRVIEARDYINRRQRVRNVTS